MARTLKRALGILETFDDTHRRMTLSEVSDRVGLARSTCLRLLQSLEEDGYLVRIADNDLRYCLSLKVFNLARYVDETIDVRTIAHQLIVDLAQKTGATVTLNMRQDSERVSIDVVLPNAQLMRVVKMGERVRIPVGAIGRVLAAHCEDDELERILEASSKESEIDRIGLRKRLKQIRKRGYDIAYGERIPGTSAVAAPIFDVDGKVNYCLCVIGPSVRIDDRTESIVDELLLVTKKISRQIGFVEDVVTPVVKRQPRRRL